MTQTPTELVRLLMTDTDEMEPIFSDEEVGSFLALTDNEILLAAAMGLDTMASSNALVLKKVNLMGVETDGPAVAAALRSQAASLRKQWKEHSEDGGFPIGAAEFADDTFLMRGL